MTSSWNKEAKKTPADKQTNKKKGNMRIKKCITQANKTYKLHFKWNIDLNC